MQQNVAICLMLCFTLYFALLLRTGMKNGVVLERPLLCYVCNYYTKYGIANIKFRYTCMFKHSGMPKINNRSDSVTRCWSRQSLKMIN